MPSASPSLPFPSLLHLCSSPGHVSRPPSLFLLLIMLSLPRPPPWTIPEHPLASPALQLWLPCSQGTHLACSRSWPRAPVWEMGEYRSFNQLVFNAAACALSYLPTAGRLWQLSEPRGWPLCIMDERVVLWGLVGAQNSSILPRTLTPTSSCVSDLPPGSAPSMPEASITAQYSSIGRLGFLLSGQFSNGENNSPNYEVHILYQVLC